MSRSKYTPKAYRLSMAELNSDKALNVRLATHLAALAEEAPSDLEKVRLLRKAEAVYSCATIWTGQWCPVCKKVHDMHTTGCKHKLCPICATRMSRVTAIQAMDAVEYMRAHASGELGLALLTLTVRNVSGEELSSTVDRMLRGWQKLVNLRPVRQLHGWARTIEIVPSIHGDGTYHPHIHVLVVVGDSFLMGVDWWVREWRRVMNLDYDPICDLRPVDDCRGAVYEVSKYVSKMTRVYDGSVRERDHVRWLCQAIYRRRLRSYGGAWKEARRMLNMMEAEDMDDDALSEYGEVLDLSGRCPSCGADTIFVSLYWSGLEYVSSLDE